MVASTTTTTTYFSGLKRIHIFTFLKKNEGLFGCMSVVRYNRKWVDCSNIFSSAVNRVKMPRISWNRTGKFTRGLPLAVQWDMYGINRMGYPPLTAEFLPKTQTTNLDEEFYLMIMRPSRCLHMTPLDFFLRGRLKKCSVPKQETIQQLPVMLLYLRRVVVSYQSNCYLHLCLYLWGSIVKCGFVRLH